MEAEDDRAPALDRAAGPANQVDLAADAANPDHPGVDPAAGQGPEEDEDIDTTLRREYHATKPAAEFANSPRESSLSRPITDHAVAARCQYVIRANEGAEGAGAEVGAGAEGEGPTRGVK